MSWDVSIMRFSQPYDSIEEIDADERGMPLGSPSEVHGVVLKYFPGTDWSDPAWGQFDCPFGSIEFNLGEDVPSTSMMLHVRASDEIVEPILCMCEEMGWYPIDCSEGDFLRRGPSQAKGLQSWRKFLDKVLERDE